MPMPLFCCFGLCRCRCPFRLSSNLDKEEKDELDDDDDDADDKVDIDTDEVLLYLAPKSWWALPPSRPCKLNVSVMEL